MLPLIVFSLLDIGDVLLVAVRHLPEAAQHQRAAYTKQRHAHSKEHLVPILLQISGIVCAVQMRLGRVLKQLLRGLQLILRVDQSIHKAAALRAQLGRRRAGKGSDRVHQLPEKLRNERC